MNKKAPDKSSGAFLFESHELHGMQSVTAVV